MQQTIREPEWQQLQERIDALFGHLLKTDVQVIEHKGPASVPLLEMPPGHAKRNFTSGK